MRAPAGRPARPQLGQQLGRTASTDGNASIHCLTLIPLWMIDRVAPLPFIPVPEHDPEGVGAPSGSPISTSPPSAAPPSWPTPIPRLLCARHCHVGDGDDGFQPIIAIDQSAHFRPRRPQPTCAATLSSSAHGMYPPMT